MSIEERAKEIIENIINFSKKNPSKSEIDRFVKEQLKKYSDEVKKIVEKKLVNILGDFYYANDNPQIAITPVALSDMLYKNAANLAKEVSKILSDSIKAKETVGVIAKKLFEGYGFKDKEVLEAVKVLPKYLKEAIKKRDAEIMKQIEKLKTKPLRIAYKDIVRRFDELSDEELEKFIKTAYYEKMRYYAKRIADTETHRAAMSKRAREYLNDENVEFVRFEMSAKHPKIDICDFYANLDIGYGRGIVPKSEMRTLPLHPNCSCVYSPYYGKVKGRRKNWNKAVNDTMSKFNEAQQREILGTYDMLNRFKGGEDIESIFNTVRPKYPIRKYVDIFENKDYNNFMEKYESAILEKFKDFDVSSKEKAIESFKGLWRNEDKFFNHIKRRKDLGHIKDEYDYLYKTLKCLADTKKVDLAIYKKSWDNVYFKAEANDWAVIFNEKGKLMTSYKKEENMPQFKEAHKNADEYKEGVKNGLQKYFKQIYDTFRNNTK